MMRSAAAPPSIPRARTVFRAAALLLLGVLPLSAEVQVEFTGNRAFNETQLRAPIARELREISGEALTPVRGDDAAFYVGTFYRKAGFSQVSVDYEIRGSRLRLKIKEGPRTLIRKITYTGNRHIAAAELDQYMIGATQDKLAKTPEQFPYTTAEVQAGVDRIRGLYLSEGYLNVAIDASNPKLSAGGTRADVDVRIVEGLRHTYSFDAIRFDGPLIFSREELIKGLGVALEEEQKIPAEATGHWQAKPKTPKQLDRSFSPGIVVTMQRNLQSFYKAHGYYKAEVTAQADPAQAVNGRVPITFIVRPDGLFRFGNVSVKNETDRPRLDADFLPKRFAHLQGQVYDPDKLDETYREMLRTGLFENLRVTPTAVDDHRIRLDLTAKEAKAKELGFSLGYGSYEGGTVGFRAADRDLFGHGRPLTFSFDYSQRGLRGELLYVDPWFLDSRFAMRSRLYSQARDEQGYSHTEIGARVDFSRKMLPHLELGTFIEGQSGKVTNAVIDPEFLGPTSYTVLSLGLTQTTDFRNDPINPARGFIFSSAFDAGAINGGRGFTRGAARFSYYLPLGKTLLAFGARGSYIEPLVTELPIELRFFNGGATTVRSFAERQLGPKDRHTNPLGGDISTVFNVEWTFPLAGALEGATFVDAGSLRNRDIPGSGEMRYAVGLGLRYKLPIGPLRLDYGVNPDRHAGEAFGAFHFSFGFAF